MSRYLRYEKFRRSYGIDWLIEQQIYAYRHKGFCFEPAENYDGLILVNYFREAEESAVEVITEGGSERRVLTVPAEVDGVPVVAIGKAAFYYEWITDIILPKTIQYVCEHAFFCCKCERIEIPGKTIVAQEAFFKCEKLKQVIISQNVSIDNSAFYECKKCFERKDPEQIITYSDTAPVSNIQQSVFKKEISSLENIVPRSIYDNKKSYYPEERPEQERNGIIDPEYLLIAEDKYRPNDILSIYLCSSRSSSDPLFVTDGWIRADDKEKARRHLKKQGELLEKYLGLRIEISDRDTQDVQYTLYLVPGFEETHNYIHYQHRNGVTCWTKTTSSDMPALVHACNEMISEYMKWCSDNGEDIYYALILPCGKTPYYYHIPSPCDKHGSILRDILLPNRLLDEWNTIDDRQARGEFLAKLSEIYERGDLIVINEGFDGVQLTNGEYRRLCFNVEILGLAYIKIWMNEDGTIEPDLYSMTDSRLAGRCGVMSLVDCRPSSFINFCDMPPGVINEVLKKCIPVLEKEQGISCRQYKICGKMKLKEAARSYIYELNYNKPTAYDVKRDMWQHGSIHEGDENLYFTEGTFDVANIYLKEDGNWDVSEIVEYSKHMRALDDKYCTERYGWKI